MKIRLNHILPFIALFCCSTAFGQYSTMTYKSTKPPFTLKANNQCSPPGGYQDRLYHDITFDTSSTPTDTIMIDVVTSCDPNEIVGPTAFMSFTSIGDTVRWISAEQRMQYTIYFENDPELATAAAQVVSVRLKLDRLMNMADFAVGSFGFGSHIFSVEGNPLSYQTRLDLRDEMNLYVDVVAGIDIVSGEAFWIFSSIDPITGIAPTETNRGFLAINDSTHAGEGFVTFSIKPKTALCHTGDSIHAQATIVFDINEPIVTNRWVNAVDAVPPTSSMEVVQETADSLYIAFSGTDDATGITAYRLYYTEGRSAYRLAGRYMIGDTAVVEKLPNIQYTFFSLGEDYVGNIEPMKATPDTLFGNTMVQLLATVTPANAATITGTGSYAQGDTAQLSLHPIEGYRLKRWTSAGIPQDTDTSLSLVLEQNTALVAEMELIRYPVTVTAADGTTIEVLHSNEVVLDSASHFDTLDIHLSSSPCYSNISFMLNNSPLTADTTIVVHDAITLTSTAVANIDSIDLYDTVCPNNAYTANGFNILASATSNTGTSNFQLSTLNSNGCDSLVNLHLYVKPSHTITFVANGGTGTMALQQVCDGDNTVLNPCAYTRDGYFFAGWSFTAGDDTIAYSDEDIVSLTSNQTLYAVWSSSCVDRMTTRIVTACDSHYWHGQMLTASGIYNDSIAGVVPGGCDSIYRLHLTVKQSTQNIQQVTTCHPYTWVDGQTYTTDTTRMLSLTNNIGCDSLITLQLTIVDGIYTTETVTACDTYTWHGTAYTASTNTPTYSTTNPTGCDSTVTLHLTINNSTTTIETQTACDSYTWHGTAYTSSTNTPTYTTTNSVGCDSTVTLYLTINNSTTATEAITACDNYTWHGTAYTASTNTPNYSTLNSAGCDSTVTLHLTINNSTSAIETITACDSYTWHDSTYTASTLNSQFSTLNSVGCDSTVTLHLTINNSTSSTESITACDSYTWHGTAYTTSTNTPTYTTTNSVGCDSTITLHLTINNSTTATEDITACDSYTWHGTAYTTSTNTPTYTTNNTVGCDSTITLHLTINNSTSSTESITACDSYTWHDSTYTTSTNTSTYTTTNSVGCDSTITLHLTINYSTNATENITACDSYTWHDSTYTASTLNSQFSTLNSVGCDSTVTLHLTINYSSHDTVVDTGVNQYEWNGETYTESGEYIYEGQTEAGCDSIVVLQLTITNVGIADVTDLDGITIYPNPTTGKLTIDVEGVLKVEAYDNSGRLVGTFVNTNQLDLTHLPTGTYALRISLQKGNTVRRVIKQ